MTKDKGNLDSMILDLASDLEPLVSEIESGTKTTKGNYGRYMGLLSALANNKESAQIMALAMIKAGANKQGVSDGLKIAFP